MHSYNMGSYFQSTFLSAGDTAFASPYMAVLKPLLVTILKTCNPKRFKPNNYKRGNIINYKLKDTRKKIAPVIIWYSTRGQE